MSLWTISTCVLQWPYGELSLSIGAVDRCIYAVGTSTFDRHTLPCSWTGLAKYLAILCRVRAAIFPRARRVAVSKNCSDAAFFTNALRRFVLIQSRGTIRAGVRGHGSVKRYCNSNGPSGALQARISISIFS